MCAENREREREREREKVERERERERDQLCVWCDEEMLTSGIRTASFVTFLAHATGAVIFSKL